MAAMTKAAEKVVGEYDAAWQAMEAEIERIGPEGMERATASGWTAKGMLGHVAFWMETTEPVLFGMLRGELEEWESKDWFASGYRAGDGEWPSDTVHNARESAWADAQPVSVVLDRLRSAYAKARSALATVRDGEDEKHAVWLAGNSAHIREHTAELRAL